MLSIFEKILSNIRILVNDYMIEYFVGHTVPYISYNMNTRVLGLWWKDESNFNDEYVGVR